MKLSNRAFDILKWVAILFLPALAVLIRSVFAIWSIPYGEEISSTIISLQVFLGAILGVSSLNYKRGLTNV